MNLEHVFPVMLIQRIGWWVIHFTWQGTVIAVVTGLILALLHKADARIRYIVSCMALFSIVIFQLFTLFLKNPLPFPGAGTVQVAQNNPVDMTEQITDHVVTSRQYRSEAIPVPFMTTAISFCENHLSRITAVWIGGVFLLSFYRLFGFFQLFFIIRSVKEPIDALWEKRIRVWIGRLNIRRHVRILLSDKIDTPAVYGWINPRKLVPYASWVSMSYAQANRSQWRSGFGEKPDGEWGFTETVADVNSKVWTDYLITQSEIPLNEWTHVTIAANHETNEVVMYKNGQRAGRIDQLKLYPGQKYAVYRIPDR